MKAKLSGKLRIAMDSPGLLINPSVLQRVCRVMIDTLLVCLPNAVGSAIYSIGPVPHLSLKLVSAARRYGQTDKILWDEINKSSHNFTVKQWEGYRDHKGGILERLAWCVENQISWTVDHAVSKGQNMNDLPEKNSFDGFYHLEPILIKKAELGQQEVSLPNQPKNTQGKPIWQKSSHATVGVIKTDFLPGTIAPGDRSTRVIKMLSGFFGIQMLSLHAIQTTVEKSKLIQKERQKVCSKLSHDFRTILAKLGLLYRIIDFEISNLRESWETVFHHCYPDKPCKRPIIRELDRLLQEIERKYDVPGDCDDVTRLKHYQQLLLEYYFLPKQNKIWLRHKIRPLWASVASEFDLSPPLKNQVEDLLEGLEESFGVFLEKQAIEKIDLVSESVKKNWLRLAYTEMDWNDKTVFEEYIDLLDSLSLELDHRRHSSRNLVYLKTLVELMPEIEQKLGKNLLYLQRDIDAPEVSPVSV
jgi:hypothetical protein